MNWTQALVLPLTVVIVAWFAKRARRPAPVRDGWHIVRYSTGFRWLSVALCASMVIFGAVLIPSITEGRRAATGALVVVSTLISLPVLLSAYGMLFFWRNWIKYKDEILIVGTTWRSPQTFGLVDLQFTGEIGVRGHEYKTDDGQAAYVNTYQQGAPDLIDLLSRQSR